MTTVWITLPLEELYLEPSRNGLNRPKRVRGSGFKMVNMGELFTFDRIGNPPMERVKMTEAETDKFALKPGDLLFARQSLVLEGAGKCSIVLATSETTTFESHLIRVRLDQTKCDPLFYYHYFKSPIGNAGIRSLVNQVAAAGIRGSELAKLRVLHPPLQTQHKITAVLSAYDDLIENNTRRIQILEEMAQALYREWFVHFRFPGHEQSNMVESEMGLIPGGWDVRPLKSLTTIKSGFAFKSSDFVLNGRFKLVTIKNVQDGAFIAVCPSRLDKLPTNMPPYCNIRSGDILLSLTGNVGRVCVAYGTDYLLNQRVAKLVPLSDSYAAFVYTLFRSPEMKTSLEQIANGVAQQNLSPVMTAMLPIIMPSKHIMDCFSDVTSTMITQIVALSHQNDNLSKTRDLLLPKLISGELDVADLDIMGIQKE